MYADVIVDISHENLDKTYQYAVPEEMLHQVVIGSLVEIPFGRSNRIIKGYILSLTESANYDPSCIKSIHRVDLNALKIETQLIHLAAFIKENFGSTMNDALKAVLPIKKKVKSKEKKWVKLAVSKEEAAELLAESERKHYHARVKLLRELIAKEVISFDHLLYQLNISRSTIHTMSEQNIIQVESEVIYRNPVKLDTQGTYDIILNEEQQGIVSDFAYEYVQGIRRGYLIHGVTGSGKTEVYMEIIHSVLKQGKQVIMLIPEIALTYQTVTRFYKRFGDRISIMNSKLSGGERYDQYMRAKNGDIDIMIGPRSALFTPFHNLGLIIMDEEHEGSYKSEMPPKYHAREVAAQRAKMAGASLVLGSATPSLESYKKAVEGEYKLYTLSARAGAGTQPEIFVEDLREELKNKNKSIFSRRLSELIRDRLQKNEQIMLFINRRGYAGFVSCRSCGHVMKCPHCDVSLTSHNNGRLLCHYCGYDERMPDSCPSCQSKYIAAFGTGTQKVESFVRKEFPDARVLRMDTDTTSGKDGHEKILSAFSRHEADVLVGTQMIVKGHDFNDVTLVGIIAADLSLYADDYRASERTYQLLAQAAGRAGRGDKRGQVVIQTYNPEHYSIVYASKNDYASFFERELSYRKLLKYPPAANILAILVISRKEELAENGSAILHRVITGEPSLQQYDILTIGPAKAPLAKANDLYRRALYLKHEDYEILKMAKDRLEGLIETSDAFKSCTVQFDFNPYNM